jgi:hypothetical protein
MTLTGYDIQINHDQSRILITKTDGADGRAALIEIKPSGEPDQQGLNFAIESGKKIKVRGYFEIQIDRN